MFASHFMTSFLKIPLSKFSPRAHSPHNAVQFSCHENSSPSLQSLALDLDKEYSVTDEVNFNPKLLMSMLSLALLAITPTIAFKNPRRKCEIDSIRDVKVSLQETPSTKWEREPAYRFGKLSRVARDAGRKG